MAIPRNRQSGGITTTVGYRRQKKVNGSSAVISSFDMASLGNYRYMNDEMVENFHRRRAAGEIFNNPMFAYSLEGEASLSGYTHARSIIPGESPGNVIEDAFDSLLLWKLGRLPVLDEHMTSYWGVLSQTERDEAIAEASARAIRDYNSADANAWVTIGEFGETLALLRNPLSGILNLLTALVNIKKPGRKARLLKELSSQHLKIIFGVMPLMSEVEDMLNALHKAYSEVRSTYRGSKNLTRNIVRQNLLLHQGSVLTDSRYSEIIQVSFQVRAGILTAPRVKTLSGALGLQVNQLPKALWELLPLSFMVDWVLNVKRYIETLTYSVTNDALAQWLTVTETTQVTRVVTSTAVATPWVVTRACKDTDSMLYTAKYRNPTQLGSNRTITLRAPSGLGKLFSSLAIAAQRIL